MLFSADLVAKILAGAKTQTRRRRHGETVTGVWVDEPCRYKVGRTYAIQPGRGKPAVARLRVLSVTPQAMCDMTAEDVRAEGFETHDQFAAKWLAMYGKGSWLDPVWRISFEVADA